MSFIAPVAAGLRQLNLSDLSIQTIYNFYVAHKDGIPGIPDLLDLKDTDADALQHITIFKVEKHTDWNGLKAYCEAKNQSDFDRINPFLPSWFQKTDDKSNIWVSDTTDIPVDAKTKLANVITNASPALHKNIDELLNITPVDDMDYLQDVVLAMARVAPLFAWDLGEGDNENFRWAPALCMLGGLSPAVLRVFASCLQHEEAWQYWYSASDEDIIKDVLDAHKISGYPLGLLRCDFKDVHRVFDDLTLTAANGSLVTPRWYKSMIALHLFKYVRYYGGKEPAIFCAYKGEYNRMKLDPDALHLNLWSKENLTIAKVICQTLGLPFNQTRNNRTWQEDAVTEVLQKLQPLYLPEPREATSYPDLLVGPAVRFAMIKQRKSSLGWCRPQVAITGVARLDYDNAQVITDAVVEDTEVFNIRWPSGSATANEIANWRRALPTEVRAERFSHVVAKRLRNWNTMGFSEGAMAALDATVTIDLFRESLGGTDVGSAIQWEFPLVFVLPTGSTTEDTTNQGKTSMARIIGDALVPGLGGSVVMATVSTSPPALRSVAEPLYRFGTAIYDEFLVPDSREHFLAQAGLQNLATGGTATPGRALENDPGVKLKHPLFFAAKLVKNVKDIQNRMLPLFLDVLTKETRCTDEELAEITGGRASIQARWCHLLWCHDHNVLPTLKVATPPGATAWRFPGHLAAAQIFTSPMNVKNYFEHCADYCAQQIARAEESGLAENIGLNAGFDPKFYVMQVHETTIQQLTMVYAKGKPIEILDALQEIVEDGGRRKFSAALRGCTEASAKHRFIDMFKRTKGRTMTVHGATITWTPASDSQWKPNGDAKAYITVIKNDPARS